MNQNEAYQRIAAYCTDMATNGRKFQNYLNVQSRFDRYSVNNAVLVAAQRPYAVQLRDADAWQNNGASVRDGEQPVFLLEPRKELTQQEDNSSRFCIKSVFDILQTTAADTVQPKTYPAIRPLVSALMDASPVPFQPMHEMEMPAYYDGEQDMIFVRTGLREVQLFGSMAKELLAAIYAKKFQQTRRTSDFSAYCITYMLSRRYGVDTSIFSFDFMPENWNSMEQKQLKRQLNEMRQVFGEIQMTMYKSLSRKPTQQER